jgi:hypothetical protein
MSDKVSARDLHADFEKFSDREFYVEGEWRRLVEADAHRRPGSPLYLWTEDGQAFAVPYDGHIPMR